MSARRAVTRALSPADPLMDVFPRAFLLVFCQLAVGGLFCLAIPPFHAIERGYYKSSAFVYVLIAALTLGRPRSRCGGTPVPTRAAAALEIALWAVFVAASAAYLASLWSERVALRARLFIASWVSGFAALIALAEGYRQAPALSLETVCLPAELSAVGAGARRRAPPGCCSGTGI